MDNRRFWSLHRLVIVIALGAVMFPILWILTASFKLPQDLNNPAKFIFTPTMANWQNVVESGIFAAAGRSAFVALTAVVVGVIFGTTGAYVIAKYRTGGNLTKFGMLAAQVILPAVLVFPFLIMAQRMQTTGTLIPIIFAHISIVLPVITWFLIGFFEAVPAAIEEQARVDGLSRFQAFRQVVVPQVYPGLGAAAIFRFTLSWNDMFYGLILAPGNATILPVAISGFNTFRGVELGSMSAAIIVAVVPVVIASFFVQKRLVQGISGGAVKN